MLAVREKEIDSTAMVDIVEARVYAVVKSMGSGNSGGPSTGLWGEIFLR